MAIVDVTVRGAGIFGLSVAWELTQRGARVVVIDPHGPGAGASGGIVGALAPHVPENWNSKKAFQLESLLRMPRFWAEVEEVGGVPSGYAATGRIQPLADEAAAALARERADGARDLWQGRADWQVVDAPAGDWSVTSPTGLVVHDTLSARIHPRRAVAALVAALAARGVPITADGDDAGVTVWATGAAGLAELSADLGHEVGRGIKGQAALLRHDAADAPQLFVDGLHVIAHADGTVAIGSTTERDFDDPTATDAQLDDILRRVRTHVPALRDAPVIERWAGLRPRARSRAPMLGPWPGRPGHVVANGGFKIGFGMAPGAAQVIADGVLGDNWRIPPGFDVGSSRR